MESKSIAIIGGNGGMGKLFVRLFEEFGHDVIVADLETDCSNAGAASKADVVVIAVPIATTKLRHIAKRTHSSLISLPQNKNPLKQCCSISLVVLLERIHYLDQVFIHFKGSALLSFAPEIRQTGILGSVKYYKPEGSQFLTQLLKSTIVQ